MRRINARLSRIIAGCLAFMIALGSGADTVFAAGIDRNEAELVTVISDESSEADAADTEDASETSEETTEGAEASVETTEGTETSEETTEGTETSEETTEGIETSEETTEETETSEETSEETASEETSEEAAKDTTEEKTEENTTEEKTSEKKTSEEKTTEKSNTKTPEELKQEAAKKAAEIAEAQKKAVLTQKDKNSKDDIIKEDDEAIDSAGNVRINANTFPDPNFRAYVSEAFDGDKNGLLDGDEILVARNIYADNRNIYSLDGIEYLTELRGLYASHNHLTELDLSGNQLITGVWVAYNDFTSLDFSSTPSLEWVYCFYCDNLTSLNVSGNPKMSYIECNSSPVGHLDLSKNPVLEHLMCGDCGLKELDLSHNPNMQHLDAFRNDFTELDVTCCPKMKRLDVWDNPRLGSIDVSKCPGLQYYNCAHNNASSVDVSHNPELTKLIVSYNDDPNTGFPGLTSLDVSHNPKLVYLDCGRNSISNLDISKNTELYYLMAFTNPLKEIKIGNCRRLIKVYKDGVRKDEPTVCQGQSWTLNWGGDTSTGGDNIFCLVLDYKTKVNTSPMGTPHKPIDPDVPADTSNLITREAAAYYFYCLAGKPAVTGKSRFKDAVPGSWYYDALVWGEKNDAICVGYPDIYEDTFGVGKFISRQDLTLMLMRYAEYEGYERSIDFGRSDDYSDYYDIDYYAWEAICWACTWRFYPASGDFDGDKSQQTLEPRRLASVNDLRIEMAGLYDVNKIRKTPAKMYSGWLQTKDGSWYIVTSRGAQKGWYKASDGSWYFFDTNGKMKTGWLQTRDGSWYYFMSSGKMKIGWCFIDNKWFYFNTSGQMKTGWLLEGGKWYYFNSSGHMKTGWLQIGNRWYYFNSSGQMKTGWLQLGKDWYYFDSDGVMVTNRKVGKYYLGPDGKMQ